MYVCLTYYFIDNFSPKLILLDVIIHAHLVKDFGTRDKLYLVFCAVTVCHLQNIFLF